jgi:hypothetical protein
VKGQRGSIGLVYGSLRMNDEVRLHYVWAIYAFGLGIGGPSTLSGWRHWITIDKSDVGPPTES